VAGPARSADTIGCQWRSLSGRLTRQCGCPKLRFNGSWPQGGRATGGPSQEYLTNLIKHAEAARELARIENDRQLASRARVFMAARQAKRS
jgi:hypothetical protein